MVEPGFSHAMPTPACQGMAASISKLADEYLDNARLFYPDASLVFPPTFSGFHGAFKGRGGRGVKLQELHVRGATG